MSAQMFIPIFLKGTVDFHLHFQEQYKYAPKV